LTQKTLYFSWQYANFLQNLLCSLRIGFRVKLLNWSQIELQSTLLMAE
jgi:hypothetical protein